MIVDMADAGDLVAIKMGTFFEKFTDPLIGKRVQTLKPEVPDSEWADPFSRKWNIIGIVIDLSNAHGLCYKIEHENGVAWYDPREFKII